MNNFNLSNVEKNLKINFNNKRIIQTAFTHSSYAKQFKESQYNERLEFLGDSVLQLTITEYLFSNYKNIFLIMKERWMNLLILVV